MGEKLPESHKDLIEGPVFSVLTTVADDGSPENTVVWSSWDGSHVLVNTSEDRRKFENIQKNPEVALMAIDPENPFRWIDVRGEVSEVASDEDFRNIDKHTKLYTGMESYYGDIEPEENKGKEERIILKIKPENVVTYPSEE